MFLKRNHILQPLLENDKVRDIEGFLGKTGSGKSYEMKRRLSITTQKRVFIWDALGEYNLPDLSRHNLKGFEIIYKDIKKFVSCVFEYIYKNDYSQELKIVYQPFKDVQEFTPFCESIMSLSKAIMAIEEVDIIFPQRGSQNESFLEAIKRGRHRAVSIFWTTQRPAEVGKTLLSQSRKVTCFEITEKNDLNYLSGSFPKDKVEQLRHLDMSKHESITLP